jgi:hypothetical protein
LGSTPTGDATHSSVSENEVREEPEVFFSGAIGVILRTAAPYLRSLTVGLDGTRKLDPLLLRDTCFLELASFTIDNSYSAADWMMQIWLHINASLLKTLTTVIFRL